MISSLLFAERATGNMIVWNASCILATPGWSLESSLQNLSIADIVFSNWFWLTAVLSSLSISLSLMVFDIWFPEMVLLWGTSFGEYSRRYCFCDLWSVD